MELVCEPLLCTLSRYLTLMSHEQCKTVYINHFTYINTCVKTLADIEFHSNDLTPISSANTSIIQAHFIDNFLQK